jgi:hypothetical protein
MAGDARSRARAVRSATIVKVGKQADMANPGWPRRSLHRFHLHGEDERDLHRIAAPGQLAPGRPPRGRQATSALSGQFSARGSNGCRQCRVTESRFIEVGSSHARRWRNRGACEGGLSRTQAVSSSLMGAEAKARCASQSRRHGDGAVVPRTKVPRAAHGRCVARRRNIGSGRRLRFCRCILRRAAMANAVRP